MAPARGGALSPPLVLALALLLDAALGEPRALWTRLPHPAVVMGRIVAWAEARFNTGPRRRAKGTAVMAGLGLGALTAGALVAAIPDGGLLELAALAALLAQKSLAEHVTDVADGLRRTLADGRAAAARIVGRDLRDADAGAVARAAIESAAENLSDGVVAPAFWYLLLGLPGLLLYKITNTADSMIGYRTPGLEAFGRATARFDDLLNWVPARATALLIEVVHTSRRAWAVARRDARHHRSPNAGWPEAAMAGALGVALSGPRVYGGQRRHYPYINPEGRRDPGPRDIAAAVAALWRVWWAFLAGALVLAAL